MANQETQKLDNIIASRRAMLLGGGAAAIAALAMPSSAKAASNVSAYTDADILNFALNLEYLEANFYFQAAFGRTIDASPSVTPATGDPGTVIGIGAGTATTGTRATTTGATIVPFTNPAVKAYAIETAIEEGKHVTFLRSALSTAAVAQPVIDISVGVFTAVANDASIPGTFNPYSSDNNFLIGAYIFEDVGVTAYKGAAPLITTGTTGKGYLQAAASILAVEAYHAGLIRTTINGIDPTGALGLLGLTQNISARRSALSKLANPAAPSPDDIGVVAGTNAVILQSASSATTTTIADADLTNLIAFSRNTTEVLNIVTGNKATMAGTKAMGGFFPSGMNGTFS